MHKRPEDLPSLNWLRTFDAAAKSLSFTLAAERLNMSQSAVSQQIKLLEDHLELPLFHRQHKKLTLSNTGIAYLSRIQPALESIRRSTHDLFTPLQYGTLTLKVNTAFLLLWLAPRIAEFTRQYPDISLRIMSINWDADQLEMSNDLVINYGRGERDNMHSNRLLLPKLRPYCSPEIAKKLREGASLTDFPLIEVLGTQHQWDTWLKVTTTSSSPSGTRHQVDTLATAAELAKRGVGLFLCYGELIADDTLTAGLVSPYDHYMDVEDSYYLTHKKETPLSNTGQLFKSWLLDSLQNS